MLRFPATAILRPLRLHLRGALKLLGASAVAATTTACGPGAKGALTPAGYESESPKYRVVKAGESFLGDDWVLDNYAVNERGNLRPKSEGIYKTTFAFDLDGDGKLDRGHDALTYDLRFQHKKHEAFIWLRSLPLATELKDKDLRVLMKDYVDEIAGAGYEAVQLSGSHAVVEKRYAAELVEQSAAKLADREAFLATIDVANIDQIKLTPATRRVRVELVFVRPGTEYELRSANFIESFPSLLMIGYANLPDDFAADEPAFRAFLSEIEIAGRRGFAAAKSDAPAAGAPTGPATPDTSGK
jgi:hypothetical protein